MSSADPVAPTPAPGRTATASLAEAPTARSSAEAIAAAARRAEQGFELDVALLHWLDVLRLDPSGPRGSAARVRIAVLQARQDRAGSLAAFARLERARAGDPTVRAAIEKDATDPSQSATLRVEAALWLEGRTRAEGVVSAAERWSSLAFEGAPNAESAVAARARERHAGTLARRGRYDEARALLPETPGAAARPDRIDGARRQARQPWFDGICGALCLTWACWRLRPGAARILAPWNTPGGLAAFQPVLLLVGGMGLVAEGYEPGSGRWALLLLPGAALIQHVEANVKQRRSWWGLVTTLAWAWCSIRLTDSTRLLPW